MKKLFYFWVVIGWFVIGTVNADQEIIAELPVQTPLECAEFAELPSSKVINEYLRRLDDASDYAEVVMLGRTAGKRPFNVLLLSNDQGFFDTGISADDKLTVMIVASLHGDEASGSEAIQVISRDILNGKYAHFLDKVDFVIFPNANPDGRDSKRRHNDNGVDLNRDFLTVQEEESSLIVDAIHHYQPHILLDIHEAGAYKSVLGGEQGYLTDFEAQFEVSNHPNVNSELRDFALQTLLPGVIDGVKERGLAAQRYRGSVSSLNQPFARASLFAGILRNYGGLHGTLCILQENRLDADDMEYPTPLNIQVRVEKQILSTLTVLEQLQYYQEDIKSLVDQARQKQQKQRVIMVADFGLNEEEAVVEIPLMQLATGEAVTRPFVNYGAIITSTPIDLPEMYAITAEQAMVATILDRHHIYYDVVDELVTFPAKAQQIKRISLNQPVNLSMSYDVRVELEENDIEYELKPGDLLVKTDQPLGILLPILLDPRSSSSLFQNMDYRPLLLKYNASFLVPLDLAAEEDELVAGEEIT